MIDFNLDLDYRNKKFSESYSSGGYVNDKRKANDTIITNSVVIKGLVIQTAKYLFEQFGCSCYRVCSDIGFLFGN